MSCPFCQKQTPQGRTFCSSQCAKIVLAAIREAGQDSIVTIKKMSYKDLLDQSQSQSHQSVSNKCKTDACPNQTTGNYLYCGKCSSDSKEDSLDDGKCKKCKVNDRNGAHPICKGCFEAMPSKNKEVKEKKVSKYDKKKK